MLIQIPVKKRGPSGMYGTYFQISKTKGVKVLNGSFKSLNSAMNSFQMQEAMKERDILVNIHRSGVTPKCYGVTVVKRGSSYRVGIIMQHLGDTTLEDASHIDEYAKYDIKDDLYYTLSEFGYEHDDLHFNNIMIKNGKYFAIDFTPSNCRSNCNEEAA